MKAKRMRYMTASLDTIDLQNPALYLNAELRILDFNLCVLE